MLLMKIAIAPSDLASIEGSGAASRSVAIRARLEEALRKKLPLAEIPDAGLDRVTISLPSSLEHQIRREAAAANLIPSVYCARLIAATQAPVALDAQPVPESNGDELAEALRESLAPLYRASVDAIRQGKIALAEAPTGAGKGRLIAAHAIRAHRERQNVVIAAPLVVVRQLLREIQALDPEVPTALLLGRPNFIDEQRLAEHLEHSESQAPLKAWLKGGGLPFTVGARELDHQIGGGLAFLVEDAIVLSDGDVPLGSLLLDDTSDGEAEAVYRSVRERFTGTPGAIQLCSHIALAVEARSKVLQPDASALPDPIDLLIVDEAHLLESAFATVHSAQHHLAPLARHAAESGLRNAKAIEAAVDRFAVEVSRLARVGVERMEMADDEALLASATALVEVARAGLDKAKRTSNPHRKHLRRAIADISAAIAGRSSIIPTQTHVRHRPVLTTGRSNLDKIFRSLWESVGASVLVSATLYTPTASGYSGGYLRWVLAIPSPRLAELAPATAPWRKESAVTVLDPITLTPDDTDVWWDAVAGKIRAIHRTAKGGALVLLTSFRAAEAIAERLRPDFGDALVVQSQDQRALSCAARYRALHKSGVRPLWLGLGSAWTGVDLSDSDKDAADDWLLTDVYVPRIPWGLNHSMTHIRRRQALGMRVEAMEASRLLRQGIGRLVRRPGVLGRRLVVSDCRVDTPSHAAMRRMLLREYGTPSQKGGLGNGASHDRP